MKPGLTKKILKYALIVSVVIAVIVALVWLILQGYAYPWTGFGEFTKPDSNFVPRKTLWDWMQLFIIPIFLSVGVFFLNRSEREGERQRAEERSKLEREIAADRQRETALQSYLDRMTDLLLKEKLRTTKIEEVRDIARTRTLSVLRGLDGTRRGHVLLFLKESGLIAQNPIVNLTKADLTGANLYGADMTGANLTGVDLAEANLTRAYLAGASLSEVILVGAHLSDADLTGADLTGANLAGANMKRADLTEASLTGANLVGADLTKADLAGADLTGANLTGADLTRAKISDKQLTKPESLIDATMPDGTKHA